ncbi:MAG TPA: transposase [Thermoanaerobaculia bacterium]|jgi:REP element-mobilizing transposase RayT
MGIGHDTHAYRRHLPHLQRDLATYAVAFSTRYRKILPPHARDEVLACCIHSHQVTYWLDVAVVMPDHVHLLITPYAGCTLPAALKAIKGNSSRRANRVMTRRGTLWEEESFDRILRKDEDLTRKAEYILDNPLRAGLVRQREDYPWLWCSWRNGPDDSSSSGA